MSKDFRASQVETSKIIASGAIAAGKPLGLAIYSGSVASDRAGGSTDSTMLTNVGTDVFLFISGAISNSDFSRTEATLFGGDVVISGTLYAERQVIEVDSVADGDFFVTGNFYQEPDSDSTTSVAFRNAAGTTIFNVDASNKRVGIGDPAPGALLDIQGEAASGVPSLIIDHDDTDKVAISVVAANIDADVLDITADAVTTANVIDVSADSLTTGTALKIDDNSANTGNRDTVSIIQNNAAAIGAVALSVTSDGGKEGVFVDKNYSDTAAATIRGVLVDVDKTASTTSDNTIVGIDLAVNNETATNGTNNMSGIKINTTLTHAADAGTTEVKAIEATATGGTNGASEALGATITATGADINTGIKVVVPAATNDSHVKLISSADSEDLFKISVGTAGATTITTIDSDEDAANLNFVIDGAVDMQSVNAITIDASAGTIGVGTDAVNQTINIGTGGNRSVNIGKSGGTSTVSIYSKGGTLELDATGQEVNIDSAAFDVNASGAITIDGTAAIGITSTSTDTTIKSTGARVILSGSSGSDSVLVQSDIEIVGSLHGASPLKINDDIALTGSARFKEQSAPSAGENEAVLFAKEDSGVTKLFMKQSDGLEVGPLGSGGSLDDAYDTPPGGGTKSSGAGREINVDGLPVQIKVSGTSKTALAITGSVIIGSGSDGLLPTFPGTDTNFFISGSIGSRETSHAGTSAFGGDVVISGSLDVDTVRITSDGKIGIGTTSPAYKLEIGGNASLGEYLYHRNNTGGQNTFMRFEDDKISFSAGNEVLLTLTEDVSQDIVTVGDGGDVDFRVRSSAGDSLFVKGDDGKVGFGTQSPLHNVSISNSANTSLMIESGNGGAPASSSIAFRNGTGNAIESMITLEKTGDLHIVNSGSNKDIIFIRNSGGDVSEAARFTADQVLILSGGHVTSPNESGFLDTNFFVSGSTMSRGTGVKGTAVFGGDLVVSGGLYGGRFTSNENINTFLDLGPDQFQLETTANATVKTSGGILTLESGKTGAAAIIMSASHTAGGVKIQAGTGDILIESDDDVDVVAKGDIALDSDAGNVYLKDNGTTFLGFQNASNDAIIYNNNSNKDIIFKGNSGAVVEILRIDVSAKDILMAAGNNVSFGASSRYIGDGTDFAGGTANDVVIQSSNGIITAPGAGSRTTIGLGSGTGGAVEFAENNAGNNILMITESNGSAILSSSVHDNDIIFHGNSAKEMQRFDTDVGSVKFMDPITTGNDTNFIVSGSINSRGTDVRGTAVFGGDMLVSGTLRANGFPLVYDHYIPSALSDNETYLSQLGSNSTSNPTGASLGYVWHVFHHSASLKSVTHFHSNDNETIAVGFYNYGETPNSGYLPKCHVTGSTTSQQWSTSNRDRGFGTVDFTGKTLTVSGSNIINPGDLIAMFIKRIDGAPGPSYNVISFNFETYNYD